jgi:hypothetical protein
MNNIDLADFNNGQWVPIGGNGSGNFEGVFDGQGHVIKNLTITGDAYKYAGLFGSIWSDSIIKNVGIEHTDINVYYPSSSSATGGICGFSYGTINNCYNTGGISSSSYYIGGICGDGGTSVISNCYNTGNISSSASGSSLTGGICGQINFSSITNCYNSGDIYSTTNNSITGGICGVIGYSTISNCYNIGNISSTSTSMSYSGGICGTGMMEELFIYNCYNTGDISSSSSASTSYAGGICGNSLYNISVLSISNCYNTGDILSSVSSSASSYAGGICSLGYNSTSISKCIVLSERIDAENSNSANANSYMICAGGEKTNNLAFEGIAGNPINDADALITLTGARSQATYENLGWDFENVWKMVEGFDYPQLRGLPPSGKEKTSNDLCVSGIVKSYDPSKQTIIQLMKDEEPVYTTIIRSEDGHGLKEQTFTFEGVAPGTYDLLITKDTHARFIVKDVLVEEEDLALALDGRPEVKSMALRCGDISGDGLINDADLTILWRAGNYNKKAGEADNPLCDLNGDGLINDADLTILWLAYNYNRGAVVVEY